MKKNYILFVIILLFCSKIHAITFDYVSDVISENFFQHAVTADFNRDGNPDIAVACNGAIEIYSGNQQSPHFTKVKVISVTGQLTFIISSDFNRDGIPDIAVSSYSYPEKFSVLIGNGDFTFQQPLNYSAGSYPKGMVSSDFNRDGKPDIAVVSYDSGFFCYLGNGDGTFNLASQNEASYVSLYITAGDFDNDGIVDIAVSGYFNSLVHIYRGKGDGTFYTPVNIPVSSPWYISKSDFNRDGNIDLAVASRSENGRVAILIGNGDCTFKTPVYYNTGGEPWGIESADFDGDGIKDLAVANMYSQSITVLKGKDDGIFQTGFSYSCSGGPYAVVSDDFTGDGKKDIALILDQSMTILENSTQYKESGIFSPPVHYSTGQNPRKVISADFNNDGILDLAVANYNSSNVFVFTGKKDGTFLSATDYYFEPVLGYFFAPSDLVAADFTRDGKMDIAVANSTGHTYGIMKNNGNGTFSVDIFPGVNIDSYSSINSGDFNRDGIPDILITTSYYPGGGIIVHTGNGDGTFCEGVFYPFDSAWRTALGDFNKDAIIDIAATASYTQGVYLYSGRTDGTFLYSGYIDSGYGPVMPVFSDFNSDGNPDIAVCDWTSNQDVSFWIGDGQGNFNISSRFVFGDDSNPYDIVADDFNRDGSQDLIVARVSSLNLAFLAGNNNGSFTLSSEFSTETGYPRGICTGDFDRNGTIDVAVVKGDPDGLSIFYNLSIEKGDISTDGSIDISDVILCLRIAIELPVEIRGVVYNPPYPQWLIDRAKLADDGEPSITISDVIKILRRAIGLD